MPRENLARPDAVTIGLTELSTPSNIPKLSLAASSRQQSRGGWVSAGANTGANGGVGGSASPHQRGAMRKAPSSLMHSPLSIGFSQMCRASAAYSLGLPRREGKGTDAASDF